MDNCYTLLDSSSDELFTGIVCGNFPLECLLLCVVTLNMYKPINTVYRFMWNTGMRNTNFDNYLLDAIINYDFINSAGIIVAYKGSIFNPLKEHSVHEGHNTLQMDDILTTIFVYLIENDQNNLLYDMFNDNEYVNGYPYTILHRNRFICLLINGYYNTAHILLINGIVEINYIILLNLYCTDLYNDWSNVDAEIIRRKNTLIRYIRDNFGFLREGIQSGINTFVRQNEQVDRDNDPELYTIDPDILMYFFEGRSPHYDRRKDLKYGRSLARVSYICKDLPYGILNPNSLFI